MRTRANTLCGLILVACCLACGNQTTIAQEATAVQSVASTPTARAQAARIAALEKLLNKVAFRGHFNVDGRPMNDLKEELYVIETAKKLPDEDLWELTARIKYGNTDRVFPMVLQIKWAESTPIITLDRVTIPTLGTFSARVLIHDNKYAGTWTHDSVSGHLFGRIEPIKAETDTK